MSLKPGVNYPKIKKEILDYYDNFSKEYGSPPSVSHLAKKFQVSRDLVENLLSTFKRPIKKYKKSCFGEILKEDLKRLTKEAFEGLDRFPKVQVKTPCKILLVDDEHFPFFDFDSFLTILDEEGGFDYLATSEIVDLQTFSRWPKRYFEDLNQVEEAVKKWIDFLSKKFKKIIVVLGNNHHLRLLKFIETLPIDQLTYFRRFFEIYPPFLKEYEKVIPVLNSFVQIGKAVYCHFDFYSSVPIKTAQEAYNFIRKYADVFHLEEVDSVWVGHTHCLRMDFSLERILLAEIGCLTKLHLYLFDRGKISYQRKNRWTLGYGVLYLNKDGSTDYKKSKIGFLGYSNLDF